MLERWRRRRENRAVVDRVYGEIVERARRPAFYIDGGLPDTVLGRFEALGIETFLLLDRCRGDAELQAFSQDVVDRFMLDLDHSLREIGIGYQSVPKRMRRLANRFYARVQDFEKPLAARDRAALTEAVRARSFADAAEPGNGPDWIAGHMIDTADAYARLSAMTLLAGRLDATQAGGTP